MQRFLCISAFCLCKTWTEPALAIHLPKPRDSRSQAGHNRRPPVGSSPARKLLRSSFALAHDPLSPASNDARQEQQLAAARLALAGISVLAIYLRQRGSPESKPVDAPHSETGE